MAFGLRCVRCGGQETEHEYRDQYGTCEGYQSPDAEGEKKMWAADRALEEEAKARRQYRGPAYEH